jgi:hypothetical protein
VASGAITVASGPRAAILAARSKQTSGKNLNHRQDCQHCQDARDDYRQHDGALQQRFHYLDCA